MQSALERGHDHTSHHVAAQAWKVGSALAVCAAFLLTIFGFVFYKAEFSGVLFVLALLVLFSVALLHARFLYLVRHEYRETNSSLETQRHQSEETKTKSLALAKSAWQEADALRNATLALTQDLRMDSVLDNLLATLHSLVPYQTAQVLLLETDTKLFLARECASESNERQLAAFPETLDAFNYPVIQKALKEQDGLLIPDTLNESGWRIIASNLSIGSWLGVPLRSSDQVVGLLSAAHPNSDQFTTEHLRVTRSLAITAAVAIQNARLYERAEIYGAELGRLSSLPQRPETGR